MRLGLIVSSILLAAASLLAVPAQPSAYKPFFGGLPSVGSHPEIERQKRLEDKKSLEKFLSEIGQASAMGNMYASYALGLFWGSDHTLKDGTKTAASLEKSTRYFDTALKQGMSLAAYNLAVIYGGQERFYKALQAVERGLAVEDGDPKAKAYLVNMYAAIALQKFGHNRDIVERAIALMNGPDADLTLSGSQFLLANLYNFVENDERASFYLTKACTNPKITPELKKICYGGGNIEIAGKDDHRRGGCPSCGLEP